MPNSVSRDTNGLSVSKVCGRCGEDLAPAHFNLSARCWPCEDAEKADKAAREAALTPTQRLQRAIDKYRKEYSHLLSSQHELINLMLAQLPERPTEGFLPESGPNAVVANDWTIRELERRLKEGT